MYVFEFLLISEHLRRRQIYAIFDPFPLKNADYGWFLQNLGKDFIRTIMHMTVMKLILLE